MLSRVNWFSHSLFFSVFLKAYKAYKCISKHSFEPLGPDTWKAMYWHSITFTYYEIPVRRILTKSTFYLFCVRTSMVSEKTIATVPGGLAPLSPALPNASVLMTLKLPSWLIWSREASLMLHGSFFGCQVHIAEFLGLNSWYVTKFFAFSVYLSRRERSGLCKKRLRSRGGFWVDLGADTSRPCPGGPGPLFYSWCFGIRIKRSFHF